MSKAKTLRKRKVRRRAKMVQRSGGKHKVNHKAKTGRTGSVHQKKLATRRQNP